MSCALVTGVQTCALPIFGALAPGDDLAECLRVVANIFDDTALDAHRLPEGSHFIVQPLLGDRNSLVALHHLANAARELPHKLLAQLIDAEVDTLRLPHQPVDLTERLAKLVELRKVDARKVFALVHEHLSFVLEALDLIVDLAQRSRGGEQILPIVGSEERRGGKGGVSTWGFRWAADIQKKKK